MSDPYVKRAAGDFIVASDWNEMQTKIRDHITAHTHSGENEGTKLTGPAIAENASLKVKSVNATESLTVGDKVILTELAKIFTHTHSGATDHGTKLTGTAIAENASLKVKSVNATESLTVGDKAILTELAKIFTHTHSGATDHGTKLNGAAIAENASLKVRSVNATESLTVGDKAILTELAKIFTHTHSGATDHGPKLTGAAIDATALLKVHTLEATNSLKVGTMNVPAEITALTSGKVNKTGDTISGALTVDGAFKAQNCAVISSKSVQSDSSPGLSVEGTDDSIIRIKTNVAKVCLKATAQGGIISEETNRGIVLETGSSPRIKIENSGNVTVTSPLFGAARGPTGAALRIAVGFTTKGEGWTLVNTSTISIVVDTRSAGFTKIPYYFTTLVGTSHIYEARGVTSIYDASKDGFRVFLDAQLGDAIAYKWAIHWCAIGD